MIATDDKPAAVLAVDVGGSHVKALASNESERRRFEWIGKDAGKGNERVAGEGRSLRESTRYFGGIPE